ncbi:MAG: hypothetical protein ACRDAM_05330, partial [Casimicrobium sp.]
MNTSAPLNRSALHAALRPLAYADGVACALASTHAFAQPANLQSQEEGAAQPQLTADLFEAIAKVP